MMNRLQPSFVKPTTKLTSGGEVNPLAKLTTRMKIQWERARVPSLRTHHIRKGSPGEPERALKVPLLACLLACLLARKANKQKSDFQ
jgi:hypothetical protein